MISLVDVARACDISKAGLYYHFNSKQELLAAIISYAQDIHEDVIQKVLADSTGDDAEELRRLIHSHAVMMTREDDAAFAILAVDEMRSLLPADRARVARRKRSYLGLIRERLAAAGGGRQAARRRHHRRHAHAGRHRPVAAQVVPTAGPAVGRADGERDHPPRHARRAAERSGCRASFGG